MRPQQQGTPAFRDEPGSGRPGPDTWLWMDIPSMEYHDAWDLQGKLVRAMVDGIVERNVVLLLEHPPVFTLGRRGGLEHLTVSQDLLEERNIRVVQVERGGSITYHGPGQLVGYPVVDLNRARLGVLDLVTGLEEVMIRVSKEFGVLSERNPLNRGVWVGNRKLGSVGLAIRHGISFHGFALNVNLSLEPFTWVQPCGLRGVEATSLQEEQGKTISMADARRSACSHMAAVFGIRLEPVGMEQVLRRLDGIPAARNATTHAPRG